MASKQVELGGPYFAWFVPPHVELCGLEGGLRRKADHASMEDLDLGKDFIRESVTHLKRRPVKRQFKAFRHVHPY